MSRLQLTFIPLAAAVLVVCSSAAADTYSYAGMRPIHDGTHTLELDRARFGSDGHVAVWIGATAKSDGRWLQVGIAVGAADGNARTEYRRPYLYLERTGGQLIVVGYLRFGQRVHVRIECGRAICTVRAHGRVLRERLPGWEADAAGESYETDEHAPNRYRGVIDGAVVAGP